MKGKKPEGKSRPKRPPNPRGEYRPIYAVLADGPDFQQLPPDARLTLLIAKLTLGPLGIDVMYPAALEARTGLDRDRVSAAIQELRDADWLRVDGGLMWLVRGLEFEPTLSATNPKHRTYVQGLIATLPKFAILGEFREKYAHWFTESSDRHGNGYIDPSDSHPIASRSTSPSPTPSPTTVPTTPARPVGRERSSGQELKPAREDSGGHVGLLDVARLRAAAEEFVR